MAGDARKRWFPVLLTTQQGHKWDCRLCHEWGKPTDDRDSAERGGYWHEKGLVHQLLLERYEYATDVREDTPPAAV
jgi:hypothetical protein